MGKHFPSGAGRVWRPGFSFLYNFFIGSLLGDWEHGLHGSLCLTSAFRCFCLGRRVASVRDSAEGLRPAKDSWWERRTSEGNTDGNVLRQLSEHVWERRKADRSTRQRWKEYSISMRMETAHAPSSWVSISLFFFGHENMSNLLRSKCQQNNNSIQRYTNQQQSNETGGIGPGFTRCNDDPSIAFC